jgi:hypothetical protein
MSQNNLSPDVRHRLWQCYSLLLSLAEEAEKEAIGNGDGQEATIDETNQPTRSNRNGSKIKQEQVTIDGHKRLSGK